MLDLKNLRMGSDQKRYPGLKAHVECDPTLYISHNDGKLTTFKHSSFYFWTFNEELKSMK